MVKRALSVSKIQMSKTETSANEQISNLESNVRIINALVLTFALWMSNF